MDKKKMLINERNSGIIAGVTTIIRALDLYESAYPGYCSSKIRSLAADILEASGITADDIKAYRDAASIAAADAETRLLQREIKRVKADTMAIREGGGHHDRERVR